MRHRVPPKGGVGLLTGERVSRRLTGRHVHACAEVLRHRYPDVVDRLLRELVGELASWRRGAARRGGVDRSSTWAVNEELQSENDKNESENAPARHFHKTRRPESEISTDSKKTNKTICPTFASEGSNPETESAHPETKVSVKKTCNQKLEHSLRKRRNRTRKKFGHLVNRTCPEAPIHKQKCQIRKTESDLKRTTRK